MLCGFELGLRWIEDAEAAILWWIVLGVKPLLQMLMWAVRGWKSLRLSALIRQPAYLAEDTHASFVTLRGVVVGSTVVLHLVCRWRDWIGVGFQAWQDRAISPTIRLAGLGAPREESMSATNAKGPGRLGVPGRRLEHM